MLTRRGILTGGSAALALGGVGILVEARRAAARYERYARDIRVPLTAPATDRGLVRYATLAANGHNTQPWLFHTSDRGIVIRPDFSRRTPVVDPDDHHLYVSLGCAVENLAIAAIATGRPGAVSVTRNGDETGASLAFISDGMAADPDTWKMFTAIPRRQSTRSAYDGRPVPSADLDRLRRSAAVDGVHPVLLTERDAIGRMRDLVIAGNDAQMADRAFVAELKRWIRFSPSAAITRGDGLYAAASGNPALPEWIGPRAFDLAFRAPGEADKYARQIDSSAGIVVFSAASESPAGWIAAGRACQRFCLTATALGIRTAFVNQPVEVAGLRADVARVAGLEGRRPDLVLRFGYAPALPYSPRRPVEAVIVRDA